MLEEACIEVDISTVIAALSLSQYNSTPVDGVLVKQLKCVVL